MRDMRTVLVERLVDGWRTACASTRRLGAADYFALACVAVTCWLAFANARLFAVAEIDDAYITFRYADNLARGFGPVFNPGDHVEGTSSLLFMGLVAIGLRAGFGALQAARFFCIAAFMGMPVLAYATVASVARRGCRIAGVGAAAIVAASTPLAYYANTGLETCVYAFLVMLALCLLVRTPPEGGRVGWAVAAGLIALARPEGVFFAGMLWALSVARAAFVTGNRSVTMRVAARTALAIGCIVVPLIIFRRAYYHEWVPNTVIAKSGSSHRFAGKSLADAVKLATTGQGADALAQYAGELGIGLYLAPAAMMSARTRFAALVSLSIAAACVATNVWNDGDWMGFHRLLTAAMGPVAVAIALGVWALFWDATSRDRKGHALAASLGIASLALVASGSFYERHALPNDPGSAGAAQYRYIRGLAITLSEHARDDDLLATDMAGFFPYYAKIRTIDTFGLCDRHIAQFGKTSGYMGKTDIDFVIGKRPTFYYFNFVSGLNDLYGRPAFAPQAGDYLAVVTPDYLKYPGRDRKLLAVRKDRPDLDGLAKAFGAHLVDLRDELHRLGMR